ncbi:MAG: zf-HC2 domain-containing protein [Oscillospiraceae bacterium]|nr:zf-HC2 domain-containing protein [Oscillospiraceae bacterium]
MEKLPCTVVQDLLPLYVENLVNEETGFAIGEHLADCKDCRESYVRMQKQIRVESPVPPASKKMMWYLNGVRIWYLVCPLIAVVLLHFNFMQAWHWYAGVLTLFSILCISSYFSGLTHFGFDTEQIKYQEEAHRKAKEKWGIYRVSPMALCLPAVAVLAAICIPETIIKLVQLWQSGFFG